MQGVKEGCQGFKYNGCFRPLFLSFGNQGYAHVRGKSEDEMGNKKGKEWYGWLEENGALCSGAEAWFQTFKEVSRSMVVSKTRWVRVRKSITRRSAMFSSLRGGQRAGHSLVPLVLRHQFLHFGPEVIFEVVICLVRLPPQAPA